MTSNDGEWDPRVAAWLRAAYRQSVDVETAARHLWVLHDAAPAPEALEGPAGQAGPARKVLASAVAAVLLLATSALTSIAWDARSSQPRQVTAGATATVVEVERAEPLAAPTAPEREPVRQVVEIEEEDDPQRPSLADLAQALPGRSP